MHAQLCYTDAYARSTEGRVVQIAGGETPVVVLDRTVFYPGGGGQPADHGTMRRPGDGRAWLVSSAKKVDGEIGHALALADGSAAPADELPTVGDLVEVEIEWARRHQLMRTHTALHALCGVVWRDYGALVTGGNMEPGAGRMDFEFERMSGELVGEIEAKVNHELELGRDVRVNVLPRAEAFAIPDLIRTKINLLPPGIEEIRTIEIVGLDLQADGGTHVANTREVGRIRVTGYELKGRINKRIRIELIDPDRPGDGEGATLSEAGRAVDSEPLSGRVALVTGAGSGIGRATALRLAADGAVIGCLDRNADGAHAVTAEIEAAGGRALALIADVTDPVAVEAAAHRLRELGPVAILVNNAGVPGGGRFVDVSFEAWRRVLAVHVDGTFHATQAVLPGMLDAGWGRIVNIASEAVWLGNTSVQYATAKAALVGFTRALARQVAGSGVLVNAVAPGPVETPMLFGNSEAEIEAELQSVLIGRFLQPDEIARTVAFLAGPGGDAYVGQVLSPNGGTVFGG